MSTAGVRLWCDVTDCAGQTGATTDHFEPHPRQQAMSASEGDRIFAAVHESASLIGRLGVKRFQTIHDCGVGITRGLVLCARWHAGHSQQQWLSIAKACGGSVAILPKRLRFCRGTPQKKGTGTMAGPPEARLAFGNNRRRRRSLALAVRCSVGLCVSPSDAKESQRRCRQ